MTGLSFAISFPTGRGLLAFMMSRTFSRKAVTFFFDGLIGETGDEFECDFVEEEFVVPDWIGVFAFSQKFVDARNVRCEGFFGGYRLLGRARM